MAAVTQDEAGEVDWSIFAGVEGGHRFEMFCADLLSAQGFAVEHMAKGGNDEGKDILLLQHAKNLAAPPPAVTCLVECKARTSKDRKAISLDDINRSLCALLENDCACLVVFTTHKFNSQAVNSFLRINKRGQVRISWIDQDDIVRLGDLYPHIWRRHMGCDPPRLSEAPSSPNGLVAVPTKARPIFWGDDEPPGILVQNCGSGAGRVTLRRGESILDEAVIDHHERTLLRVPRPRDPTANPYENLFVRFASADPSAANEELAVPDPEIAEWRTRIDHRFADPDGVREQVLRAVAAGKLVHLRGSAGSGKSRLIAECCKSLPSGLFVDASREDEGEPIFEALVQEATGWPAELLAQVPEQLVACLSSAGGSDGDSLAIVADFCAQRRGHTLAAVAGALVGLAGKFVGMLVVDNIQDVGPLDEAVLKEALGSGGAPLCLVATRLEDGRLPPAAERALRGAPVPPLDIELDDCLAHRIRAFAAGAAADCETADYLLNLIGDESFQRWSSKLKALRQQGALEVEPDGRVRVRRQIDQAGFGTYLQLQETILYSRLPEQARKSCTETIEAAAIFGTTFPVAFVEHLLGEAGLDALDELERRELIRAVREPSTYGLCFRFDHALTRNAVAGAISTIRKTRLHRAAAEFIETWSRFQPGTSHYEAAAHYRLGGFLEEALDRYEDGARHFVKSGRVGEAQSGLLTAVALFDEQPIDRPLDSIARELDLRELLLEGALLVGLPDEEWARQIDAFQIQTHLFPAASESRRRLARGYCFAACLAAARRRVPIARREMAKALDLLDVGEEPLAAAEAMKWGANLQKNLGRYDEAAAMAANAYRIYDDQGDRRRAGEAATELSHVLYEAFKFGEAYEWGETALDHYAAVGHPSLVARARIDLARMLAMLRPDEGAEAELEWSVRLARHAGIGSHVAKALMNWGIFLGIERADVDGAFRRFHDSAESLRLHPNSYLATLLDFVRATLPGGAGAAAALRDSPIGARLVEWCRHYESPAQIGDRRMQQMLKSFAAVEHAQVAEWLRGFPGSPFEPYIGIGLDEGFEARESGNPLFRRGGQRLYY